MKRLILFLALILCSREARSQVNISGTTCPGTGCTDVSVNSNGSVGIQITGTWSGTITFRGSVGTTSSSTFVDLIAFAANSTTAVTTATSNGVYLSSVAGLGRVRVIFTSYTSGTAVVSVRTNAQARKAPGNGGGGGGSGTVTSVGLTAPTDLFNTSGSPITTAGTIDLSLENQSANQVFAGPTTGSAAAPAFRSLVAADISGLIGAGTVTSVGISAPTAVFNVAGSPITSNGTLALTFDSQLANRVFAGPTTGAAAEPTFRALVAADIVGAGSVSSVGLLLPTSVFDISGSPVTSTGTLTGTFDNQNPNTFFAGPSTGSATTPAFRALAAADLTGLIPPTNATYITQTTSATLTNEQALSSLTTGILKSTTATGVVSIATSADTIAQWTGTPSATNVLVSDGTLGEISTDFDVITSATNTTAAMILGSGSSLTTSGTGTNAANYISNLGTAAPSGTDCDAVGETGKLFWDSTNDNLYVCSGASGWRKITTAAP